MTCSGFQNFTQGSWPELETTDMSHNGIAQVFYEKLKREHLLGQHPNLGPHVLPSYWLHCAEGFITSLWPHIEVLQLSDGSDSVTVTQLTVWYSKCSVACFLFNRFCDMHWTLTIDASNSLKRYVLCFISKLCSLYPQKPQGETQQNLTSLGTSSSRKQLRKNSTNLARGGSTYEDAHGPGGH